MKTFSVAEKTIARNIDCEYKWMARDQDGDLCIYDEKPRKRRSSWFSSDGYDYISYFNHLFPAIKWEDSEPTKISDIYNPPILNDLEREYLKTVLKPFHDEVEYVKKTENSDKKEYLFILFSSNRVLSSPDFDSGTRYSGMKLDRKYSLDELGITYEEKSHEEIYKINTYHKNKVRII